MLKKTTCMFLVLSILLSVAGVASAAEAKSMDDLIHYMELSEAGTIMFDSHQALLDGFSNDMVTKLIARVQIMNQWVMDGITTIDENFTARIYIGNARSDNRDRTYVDVSVLYVTTIYLSVADTDDVVENLPTVYLVDIIDIVSAVNDISQSAAFGIIVAYGSLWVTRTNIINAAANGTGIAISIHDDGTTSTPFTVITAR